MGVPDFTHFLFATGSVKMKYSAKAKASERILGNSLHKIYLHIVIITFELLPELCLLILKLGFS